MVKNTYLSNLHDTLISANNKSKSQWQHNAWDNKKINNRVRYTPRGGVFERFEAIERAAWWVKEELMYSKIIEDTLAL